MRVLLVLKPEVRSSDGPLLKYTHCTAKQYWVQHILEAYFWTKPCNSSHLTLKVEEICKCYLAVTLVEKSDAF